jgi:hypothetical protein
MRMCFRLLKENRRDRGRRKAERSRACRHVRCVSPGLFLATSGRGSQRGVRCRALQSVVETCFRQALCHRVSASSASGSAPPAQCVPAGDRRRPELLWGGDRHPTGSAGWGVSMHGAEERDFLAPRCPRPVPAVATPEGQWCARQCLYLTALFTEVQAQISPCDLEWNAPGGVVCVKLCKKVFNGVWRPSAAICHTFPRVPFCVRSGKDAMGGGEASGRRPGQVFFWVGESVAGWEIRCGIARHARLPDAGVRIPLISRCAMRSMPGMRGCAEGDVCADSLEKRALLCYTDRKWRRASPRRTSVAL